VTKNQHS